MQDHLKLFILLLFALSSLGTLKADALILPKSFKVLDINKKRKSNFFSGKHSTLLSKGPQKVLLQYQDFYGEEKVISEPFLISFLHKGGIVLVEFSRPTNLSAAKVFAKKPNLKFYSKANKKSIEVKFNFDHKVNMDEKPRSVIFEDDLNTPSFQK